MVISDTVAVRPRISISQSWVDSNFRQHLARYFSKTALPKLREQFGSEHFLPLRGFCPPILFQALKAEALGLIERYGVVCDTALGHGEGAPSQIATVDQPVIVEQGPLIHATYFSPVLKDTLSEVAGEALYTCPHAGEHYRISQLRKSCDTHGWHWDDYAYGFVLILEAPHYRDGGLVQGVAHTSWDKRNPDVHGALRKNQVYAHALEPGDAYLVKTDTTMHRVYSIRGDARRTLIHTTWANRQDLRLPKSHETRHAGFHDGAAGSTSACERA
ncbi:hypothetical protein FNU76_05225 [Chitinimonas arctica]|uniref:ArpA protein n=1 Tax=Chitinimonas arctica TaxID=2594795 RepID=A0A516SCC8_9NEIS|nr:hypothetical protein [Chitinimonas arctica]QDQ25800.1 hypothetical protein FNU76_05225 [Chitinimonas arctica]